MTVFLNYELSSIYEAILHDGILKYKKRNSKKGIYTLVESIQQEKSNRKGGIFVVRDKSHFTSSGVKGYIITSKESLLDNAENLTHWTPNIYRKYQYSNEKRNQVYGFEEKNLQQVNTFVIDIDTKKYTPSDIALVCMDESIGIPSLILESDRGYQVYFFLERPLFISNKNNFRSLKVAKRIAENLKRSLESVEADLFCNDFGFFRVPNQQNIVFYRPEQVYTVKELIDWSMRSDDDQGRLLYSFPVQSNTKKLTKSQWFQAFLNVKNVKGEQGVFGRNNLLFTMALACYSDGFREEQTIDLLDRYNSSLNHPISLNELLVIIQSAYSGKYKSPKSSYVRELLELHVPNSSSISASVGVTHWYKHKKKRVDRQRSHIEEWEQDILNYLEETVNTNKEPFVWHTQKELCSIINIPQSTLNKLLLKSKKIIKKVKGKGRNAKTGWTTVQLFIKNIITNKQNYKLIQKKINIKTFTSLKTNVYYTVAFKYINHSTVPYIFHFSFLFPGPT